MGVRSRIVRGLISKAFSYKPRNFAGYANATGRMASPSDRLKQFMQNNNSSGLTWEDDFEIDKSTEALGVVRDYMYGQCANSGQESLISDWLDGIDIAAGYINDTGASDDEWSSNGHEPWAAMEFKNQPHPEAVGLIIEGAYEALANWAESLPREP